MSPTIFGYIVLSSLLLAGAAAAVEWGLQGRVATRHVWTAAIVLALLAPPAALAWHASAQRSATAQSRANAVPEEMTMIVTNSPRADLRHTGALARRDAPVRSIFPNRNATIASLSRLSQRFANITVAMWALLSLSLIAWLAAGAFRLRRVQRAWRRTTVDGVDVDVSPLTGPAVLGFLSHRIVLPAWATTLPPEHRRLVLAHECEHISARDPERLALGIAALILMPWNVALWWCSARLRRAIELDCDARVLRRFPSTKEYGYVLLEVAARGRNTGALAIPMVGLLRLPSELELRLRAMTRSRTMGFRGAIGGGIAAFVAITAAFTTPVPSLQLRTAAEPVANARPMRVQVRTAELQFDSVAYSGTPRTPRGALDSGTMQLLGDRRSRADTGSKHRADTTTTLGQQLDSLSLLKRELRDNGAALMIMRAQLDSTRTALQLARAFPGTDSIALMIERARAALARADASGLAEERTNLSAERLTLMQQLRDLAEQRRQFTGSLRVMPNNSEIDSAVKRYYPDLAQHPDSNAVLWFVADSAGRVVRTKRDDSFGHSVLTSEKAHERFVDLDPADISYVSIQKLVLGHTRLSVIWIGTKH